MLTLQDVLLSKANVHWSMDEPIPLDLHAEMCAAGIMVDEAHCVFLNKKFKKDIYEDE
tara:strand:- start:406 stop:579 length:174 start_codon:yes stop_codon:yes gene_type:complete